MSESISGIIHSFFPKAVDWGWYEYISSPNITLDAGETKNLISISSAKKQFGFDKGFIVGGMFISSTIYGGIHAEFMTPRGNKLIIDNTPAGLNLLGLTSPCPGILWLSKYASGITNFENVVNICPSLLYPVKGSFKVDIKETSNIVSTIIRLITIMILAVYDD